MGDSKSEFQIIRFKKGENIFKEGEEGDCAYLIRSGVVKIYRMVNNTKLSITHLKAGQIMGEMAVITSAPRSASAEAAENSELVKIDQKSLNNALGNTIPVIKAMLDQLIHRFRLIDKQSMIKESDKIMLCACSVVDTLRYHPQGIDYKELYSAMNDKFHLSESVFENILNKLGDQQLIRDVSAGNIRKIKPRAPSENSSDKALDYAEMRETITSAIDGDEYIHIDEFASMLKTTSKDVITRAGIGYIPEDIFFISRERAAVWAEDIGEDIFEKPYDDGED